MKGNIKLLMMGIVLILLLGILSACGKNNVATQEPGPTLSPYVQPNYFVLAHDSDIEIIRVTVVEDTLIDGYRLTQCETIWKSRFPLKYETVLFRVENFPDLQPGQVYLVRAIEHASREGYAVNSALAMNQEGYFHIDYEYPTALTGISVIDDYNKTIEGFKEHADKIPSLPEECLTGDVTLEELIAFLEAMDAAFLEWKYG